MIYLEYTNKEAIAELHGNKVIEYVQTQDKAYQDSLYVKVRKLLPDLPPRRDLTNYEWLKRFILADTNMLDKWVTNQPEDLKFTEFQDLYKKFAKAPDSFIDAKKTYNAYSLLKQMNFKVCPYCDDEYLEIFQSERGHDSVGNPVKVEARRTSDIDHFHPKGKDDFPALAMCFYNLIPSGKGCNQTMNKVHIAVNPYSADIEDLSKFMPDIPVGSIPESLTDKDVRVKLTTSKGMSINAGVLGLEDRYNSHPDEIRRLLVLRRQMTDENLKEKERLGITPEILKAILGPSYPSLRGQEIHQKLRNDLLGY